MRKVAIFFTIFSCLLANAQRGKQEIKLDLFDALIFKTIEVDYEYYLDNQYSFGLSALFNLESKDADLRYNENTMISPYFNYYFTANKNWNHFGQIFIGVNFGEKQIDLIGSNAKQYLKYSDGAIGIAVGSKYAINNGITISALVGVGRNFFSENSPIFVPRIGLNLGYQF